MPKSRKRRTKNQHTKSHGTRRTNPVRDRARALADLPLLQATDAAEARGDVGAALGLIAQDMERRKDTHFWRPERVQRLTQLFAFGPSLPRWVTSRWILAQAAQQLDHRLQGRGTRAIEIAIETRGADTLDGVDEMDARVKVMDHDWVNRQVFLYELGALGHFVSRVASPDLLAGADRIHDWIRTPMGAFRLVGEAPLSITLLDLATGDEVTALNIGSATLFEVGECAIGRLVPIEGGAMFESAPLHVPEEVARQVAEEPAEWVAALAGGCRAARESGSPDLITTMPEFGMVTDVPHLLRMRLAVEAAWARGEEMGIDGPTREVLTSLGVALLRDALEERLPETDWQEKQWPMLAATMVEPGVFVELAADLTPRDRASLLRLAGSLPDPAASLCRELARQVEAAA